MTLLELAENCGNIEIDTLITFEKDGHKYILDYIDIMMYEKIGKYMVESFEFKVENGETICYVKLIDESEEE